MGGTPSTSLHLHFNIRQRITVGGKALTVYVPPFTSLISALRVAEGMDPGIDANGDLLLDTTIEITQGDAPLPSPAPAPTPPCSDATNAEAGASTAATLRLRPRRRRLSPTPAPAAGADACATAACTGSPQPEPQPARHRTPTPAPQPATHSVTLNRLRQHRHRSPQPRLRQRRHHPRQPQNRLRHRSRLRPRRHAEEQSWWQKGWGTVKAGGTATGRASRPLEVCKDGVRALPLHRRGADTRLDERRRLSEVI